MSLVNASLLPPQRAVTSRLQFEKQHQAALAASGVSPFVIYDLQHTCLTRWAKVMDPFTLMKLAGHSDLNTTMRYVRMNDSDVRAVMEKVKGGHTSGHTALSPDSSKNEKTSAINSEKTYLDGAGGGI
jgi:hypothetical protein